MNQSTRVRRRLRITGVVQGVGFRPAVHALAHELDLAGLVGNDAEGVFVEVEGPADRVDAIGELLWTRGPPLARIDDVTSQAVPATGESGFRIVASDTTLTGPTTLISPDTGPCEPCLAELADPADRRHRYPFLNCTDCGPRYTIIRNVPYDRAATTMAGFALCSACDRDYRNPTDRRFHAQPVCCPACGPRLRLVGRDGIEIAHDAVTGTARLLARGAIVALKGVGGYQLLADATNDAAVDRLRARKHRDQKPFALLVPDLAAARRLVVMAPEAAELLADAARPIVVLPRRQGSGVASSVAPGNRSLGVMLPASPLHVLVSEASGRPLVCTSGNRADEPIAHADDQAIESLSGIAAAFCTHDRPIHIRADDSVARVVAGRPLLLRRARGYVPRPVRLPRAVRRPVLAVGAQLKSTVCLARGRDAFVSHHIGDLEHPAAHAAFEQAVTHYGQLFDITPAVVAHDLHPQYLSTSYATDLADRCGIDVVEVQHHHAHIASCLVDNGVEAPVIGVAFDGLGLGTDGTLWGGEILVADLASADRVAHLDPVPMPGGEAAIRQPWRMAASYLAHLPGTHPGALRQRHSARWPVVTEMARRRFNAPMTSSVGRLFDAVAAIAGLCDEVSFEGQAAIELEQQADLDETGAYDAPIEDGDPVVMSGSALVAAAAADLVAGVPPGIVAARFHNGLVGVVARCCSAVRDRTGLSTVALSGGVFQNALLVERTIAALGDSGFTVLTHRQVPPNDGGISLGQVAVAAARDHRYT